MALVAERLRDELTSEVERRLAVEVKLIAIGSVVPVPVTVLVAIVTFLTSGRVGNFTTTSVMVLTVAALYVSLQFLRAMRAAVVGLSRMAYASPEIVAMCSIGDGRALSYSRGAAAEMACRIQQWRGTTSEKVSQLALAHTAMINAVVALISVIMVLGCIAAWDMGHAR